MVPNIEDTGIEETGLEQTLGRELREVADGLHIPALPALPADPPRSPRLWQPLLVAAAAAALIAGTVAIVAQGGNDGDLSPAPQPTVTPTPTAPTPTAPTPRASETISAPPATLPRSAPTIPYVLDNVLYVAGRPVPGAWWSVEGTNAGWLAIRNDDGDTSWWWGNGSQVERIERLLDVPPVISPDGTSIAAIIQENGEASVTGFETRPGGEGFGGFRIDPGKPGLGDPVRVVAVTNDGKVIVQGQGQSLLWLPNAGSSPAGSGVTIDLTKTAAGARIVGSTSAGLVVTDETETDFMLATISDEGILSRVATLPQVADLTASPDGAWTVYVPYGSLGGELAQVSSLRAGMVRGDLAMVRLEPPEGLGFAVHSWRWENDDHLIARVLNSTEDSERMARCSMRLAECVLIDARLSDAG